MEQLLKEILEGTKEYKGIYVSNRGKGTKAYIVKRIDLLREQLLELKKKFIRGLAYEM